MTTENKQTHFKIEGTLDEIHDQYLILMRERNTDHRFASHTPYGKYRNTLPLGLNSNPENFFCLDRDMLTREAQIKLSGKFAIGEMTQQGLFTMWGVPQIPFKATALVLESPDLEDLVVYDIKIGRCSMLCSCDTLPATAFKAGVATPKLDFQVAQVGEQIRVTLAWGQHVKDQKKPIVVKGCFFGPAVE